MTEGKTLVALCTHLRETEPLWERAEASLPERLGAEVTWAEGPCHGGLRAESLLRRAGERLLVLGVCDLEFGLAQLQARLRRAGLDPLQTPVVPLGQFRGEDGLRRARLLLASATARARAYPGAGPENLMPTLLSGGERVSRRALFTLPPVTYRVVPTINRGLCRADEGCDRCVAECPHQAITLEAERVVVNPSACKSCAVCVSACPWRAVEFPSWSPREVEAEMQALFSEGAPGPVAFTCSRQRVPSGGWIPIRVPCMGAVTAPMMLQALAMGASAVGVLGCLGECAHGLDERVRERVRFCRAFLEALGRPPESVCLITPEDEPPATEPVRAWREAPHLFDRRAGSLTVKALADAHGAEGLIMEHPGSPVGRVEVNTESCTVCGTCAVACPTGSLSHVESSEGVELLHDPGLCIACGACVQACPEVERGAIRLVRGVDRQALAQGRRAVARGTASRCERCGAPIASERMLARIAEMLGRDYDPRLMGRLCTRCRGLAF